MAGWDFYQISKTLFRAAVLLKDIYYPTHTFTTFELRNPSHDVLELHKFRRSPDLEALKL